MNTPPSSAADFLPTVLSDLTSLLHLSSRALHALPIPTAATSPCVLACPFNPSHLLPPASLFLHYLNCPSPLSLSHTFQYPLTLHSSATVSGTLPFPSTSSNLSITLENYLGFNDPANHFFYRNCPGPVTPSGPPPLLNLPRVLYTECAEIVKDSTSDFSINFIRFLPSEIWEIRREIEAWGGGFPAAYSSRILRAILRLRDAKLLSLCEWIVSNSPRYGVIIDFPMGNHIVLLIRLSLKVIVRESLGLIGFIPRDGDLTNEENVVLGLSNQSFECPVLVNVMMWLASQLSVLYGEVNGKFFAVDVLKECVLESVLHSSFFPLEPVLRDTEKGVGEEQKPMHSIGMTEESRGDGGNCETVGKSVIFVSQVAASVAALHERLLIESKIKALRNSCQLSAYQRNMEHAFVSNIANEERLKRPDYRPIIEHDGVLWQRSSDQNTNKVKTREELLAEERDYKRRRMSYRGKKLKRNTLEVMRDIIKDYMEEIQQAGGIEGMPESVEESEVQASDVLNTSISGSSRNSKIVKENRGQSLDYRKELLSSHDLEDGKNGTNQSQRDSIRYPMHPDYNNAEKIRYHRDDYSGIRDFRGSKHHLKEWRHSGEKQDSIEAKESSLRKSSRSDVRLHHKYRRDDWERESFKDNCEHDSGRSKGCSADRDKHDGDKRGSQKRKSSSSRAEFEDRYDPAESHVFDDDYL